MKAVKGRVLEIGEKSIIVLTSKGEFLQRPLPKGDIQVGDEINVPVKSPLPYPRYSASAVAAVAVVVCLLLSSVGTMAAPAYYVHVDIPGSSSFELALSRNMRVLEATPLNEPGDAILSEVPVVRKSAKSAIQALMGTAENLEYFVPDQENTVLISVAGGSDKVERKTHQLIREISVAAKKQLKASKTSVTLGIATVDNSKREEALSKKSSINALLFKNQPQGTKSIPKEYKVSKVVPKQQQDKKAVKNDNREKEKSPGKTTGKMTIDKINLFEIFKEIDRSDKNPAVGVPGKSGKDSDRDSRKNDDRKWDGSIWDKDKKGDKRWDQDPGKNESTKKNVKGNDKNDSKDTKDRNNRTDKNDRSDKYDKNNKNDGNRRDTDKKDTKKGNYDRDDDKNKWDQDRWDRYKNDSKKWNWFYWKDNNRKNDNNRDG